MDKRSATWTGLITLVAGIVMLFLQGTAISIVVTILGAVLLASAIINLIVIFHQSRKANDGKERGRVNIGNTISALVSAAFGLWMLIDPAGISNLVVYVVAVLMILAGLYHVMVLGFGYSQIRFPGWFYILPVCLIVGGIIVFCLGAATVINSLVLLIGISLIVFAINLFIEIFGAKRYAVVVEK